MNVIFETDRLFLRQFSPNDAPLIFALNQIEEVTRYTGDPVRDLQHAEEILRTAILPQYELYNMGRWAVIVKDSNEFIGWCGLKFRPELDEIDLGYRYFPSSWGKGFATEAARAALDYGFNNLKLKLITGRAMPDNIASWKILEKIGMTYVGEQYVDGHDCRTYEKKNPLIP